MPKNSDLYLTLFLDALKPGVVVDIDKWQAAYENATTIEGKRELQWYATMATMSMVAQVNGTSRDHTKSLERHSVQLHRQRIASIISLGGLGGVGMYMFTSDPAQTVASTVVTALLSILVLALVGKNGKS